MSNALVSLSSFKTFLGVTGSSEDTELGVILDDVVAALEVECGRRERPFAAAQTNRAEVLDGTGTDTLVLDYPVSDVDSIALGRDPVTPDSTLDPDDVDDVVWGAGSRVLTRTDGGVWGERGERRVIRVQYDAQADTPADCQLAAMRVAAAIYRQRGSEGATAERVGGYSVDFMRVCDGDPVWCRAVRGQYEPRLA